MDCGPYRRSNLFFGLDWIWVAIKFLVWGRRYLTSLEYFICSPNSLGFIQFFLISSACSFWDWPRSQFCCTNLIQFFPIPHLWGWLYRNAKPPLQSFTNSLPMILGFSAVCTSLVGTLLYFFCFKFWIVRKFFTYVSITNNKLLKSIRGKAEHR